MPSTTSSVSMPEVLGQLRHASATGRALGQLVGGPAQPQVGLLGRPGHPHRPRVVPEVALDLAFDRAPGERRERHVAVGLEAVDGLDEGQEGDLAEVVVARAAPAEAPGDVSGQTHVALDELVAQAPAARPPELPEQRILLVALVPALRRAPTASRLLRSCSRSEDALVSENDDAVDLVVVGDGLEDARRQLVDLERVRRCPRAARGP